jgi:hypothetical protein
MPGKARAVDYAKMLGNYTDMMDYCPPKWSD